MLKSKKHYRYIESGQGFVWETDPDTIKDAADELKQAQDDLNDKIKQDQIDQLQAEKDALEKSYNDRIDALQNFLDEQNYLIDKANREGVKSFDELRESMRKYGIDSAEYLGKASEWLNNYNKALSELSSTQGTIISSSAGDGLIYSSAMQSRISSALSGGVNSGLSLNSLSYSGVGANNGQTIYIDRIELPNVQNANDFVEALKQLPALAASIASKRT